VADAASGRPVHVCFGFRCPALPCRSGGSIRFARMDLRQPAIVCCARGSLVYGHCVRSDYAENTGRHISDHHHRNLRLANAQHDGESHRSIIRSVTRSVICPVICSVVSPRTGVSRWKAGAAPDCPSHGLPIENDGDAKAPDLRCPVKPHHPPRRNEFAKEGWMQHDVLLCAIRRAALNGTRPI